MMRHFRSHHFFRFGFFCCENSRQCWYRLGLLRHALVVNAAVLFLRHTAGHSARCKLSTAVHARNENAIPWSLVSVPIQGGRPHCRQSVGYKTDTRAVLQGPKTKPGGPYKEVSLPTTDSCLYSLYLV